MYIANHQNRIYRGLSLVVHRSNSLNYNRPASTKYHIGDDGSFKHVQTLRNHSPEEVHVIVTLWRISLFLDSKRGIGDPFRYEIVAMCSPSRTACSVGARPALSRVVNPSKSFCFLLLFPLQWSFNCIASILLKVRCFLLY